VSKEPVATREHLVARTLRRGVLAVLLFGSLGTLAELFLIGHYEDTWQFAPLGLLVVVILVIGAYLRRPGELQRRAVAGVMWACIVCGLVGIWIHYDGNSEFEREMYPDRSGFELVRESLSGATPVLAAGTMTVIGLFGLVAAWRPATKR
jgi:hypothetical protein